MRYRYIIDGDCHANDNLSKFTLITGKRMIWCHYMIRIEAPDKVDPSKWVNEYGITRDTRPVKAFNPVVIVRYNGTFRADKDVTRKWLDGTGLRECSEWLQEKGYRQAMRFGFLNKKQYEFYSANYKKMYQIEKIPKDTDNFDGFWKEEDYKAHDKYITKMRNILQEDDYDVLRNMSDEEAMDIYGKICFAHTCDHKLQEMQTDVFVKEYLDERAFFQRRIKELEGEGGK